MHAEHVVQIRCREDTGHLARRAVDDHRDACSGVRGKRFEHRLLRAEVHVVRHRERHSRLVALETRVPEPHEPIGLAEGQRRQHDLVEETGDHQRRAQADRQRPDGGDRERRCLPQGAQRVAQILPQRLACAGGSPVAITAGALAEERSARVDERLRHFAAELLAEPAWQHQEQEAIEASRHR